MHGVKKRPKSRDEIKKRKEKERIDQYGKLSERVLAMRKQPDSPILEALKATEDLLGIVTEYYTAWSYRRELLAKLHTTDTDMVPYYAAELDLCQRSLMQNPKSYWVWHHRKWINAHCNELGMGECDWDRELKLCGKLLALDDRNFHCWSYRRFAASLRSNSAILSDPNWLMEGHRRELDDKSTSDEVDFSMERINVNFSNYSAWHQRSKLLPFSGDSLKNELQLVRQAFFTEPADQSAWFYYRYLLSECSPTLSLLKEELSMLNELLEIEPEGVWVLLTKAYLLQKIDSGDGEVLGIMNTLIKLDPDRTEYYEHIKDQIKN